ncbi:MAG: hypothetical protein WDZ40_00150 [Candidatus Spechtbacterales bacterium]
MTKEYYAQISRLDFNPETIISGLSSMALFVAGLVFAAFIILSVVLNHHWKEHGVTKEQIQRLRRIYFTGAGVLFGIMLISLISFMF